MAEKGRPQTLGMHITTTKFLGSEEVAHYIFEKLRLLPTKYHPTKSEYYTSKNKGKFSFDNPNEFITKVPGDYRYGGYASLYKVKQIFSIYIKWTRCPESLVSETDLVYNTIWIHFDDGMGLINNSKEFSIVESIWLDLCKFLHSWYGECHLYSNDESSNNYLGWGFGRCIPRLHWKTYFGEAYKQLIPVQEIDFEGTCEVDIFTNEGFILTINDDPRNLVTRSDLERKIINKLGSNLFWNEHDNRLSPKGEYKIPNLDYSEVIYRNF
ncbi:hypothetical protein ACFQ88_05395 [Paenibacillus sp. NPDC056579]|uniref:hypothetical protein n=1 Tax=Paenibacillus sp. NPDC056579 TaxID=3345871 RepID=UPI0036927AA2